MATITLHHSPPSELFNRLNSYAHQHPLYQALREFGCIIETIFLLRYMDQTAVRQRIQRQLNRSESVHQSAKSVWFGRHGQMGWVNPGEQQIAETAKRLIMNCIICYNYLHISEKLTTLTDRDQRQQFIQRLSKLTVLTHHHINFNGIYDFPEESTDWVPPFNLNDIADLDL